MTDAATPAAAETRARLEQWFTVGVFGVLLALAVIATFRAYFAVERAILTWFEREWVPIAQAAFSLIVLALAVWLIRAWVIERGGR